MPVDFLTEAQRRRYGRYPEEVSVAHTVAQLARFFHIDDTDHALISQRRGDSNRLGFALQLTTVRFLGTFLPNPIEVPTIVIDHVARQLGIDDVSCLSRYMERKQTRHDHRAEIRDLYGYRDFGEPPWPFRLSRWLFLRAWLGNERPSLLFDLATAWLIERKVLLPGVTTLIRLVSRIRDRTASRLWRRLCALPSAEQQERIEALLNISEGARYSHLYRLRRSPTRVSAPALIGALRRHEELQDLGVGKLDFSGIRGRPNTRVISHHFDHSKASLAFISRSNRPYGLTCSHITWRQGGVVTRRQPSLPVLLRQHLLDHQRVDVDHAVLDQVQREHADPGKVHPHRLRHACGYALANKGHDLRIIQDYPGHRDPKHTALYTRTAAKRFENLWR
jgi:integrase